MARVRGILDAGCWESSVLKNRVLVSLLTGFFLLLFCAQSMAGHDLLRPMETSRFPSLESSIRIKGPIYFCGERVPLDTPQVRERLEKELLLMLWDRAQIILWLKRTGRYFPYIQNALSRAKLPDDLKYVAVIESALRPHAGSNKGARGVWQFIPSTARNYGLTVDRYIDERRNYRLATGAAIEYFKELHGMFGAWALACAGYNMGEIGLKKRIEQQEVRDFYKLDLPTETERYVLRAMAAKLILSDPNRYGFKMLRSDYYKPVPSERVKIKAKHTAPVVIIAKAAGSYYKEIKDLNPQLLSDVVPSGTHTIFLPRGAAKHFSERYQPLIAKYRKAFRGKTYTVRRGDNLTSIARKQNLPLWKLLKLNNLHRRSVIRPGQKLVIMR